MSKKVIHYKPGKITLYDNKIDAGFYGSLLLRAELEAKKFVREELPAIEQAPVEEFDQNIFEKIPEEPQNSPVSDWSPGSYWGLIDFGLLFRFIAGQLKIIWDLISKITKSALKSLFLRVTEITEILFYSKDEPLAGTNVTPQQNRSFWQILRDIEVPKIKFPQFKINIKLPRIPSFDIPKKKIDYPSKNVLKSLAAGCLIISFLSLGGILLPLSVAKINSAVQKAENFRPTPFPSIVDPEIETGKKLQVDPSQDVQTVNTFKLSVPKIGLESDIAPNVDLQDEAVYKQQLLSTGVAHAKGSYFPGEEGTVFLFAHSTDTIFNISRFNAKFFALEELKEGDDINIVHRDRLYRYKVTNKTIVTPSEVDFVRDSGSSLVLMTCTPPGTDWNRLLIFAEPVI